jgi:hypothetical protein
LRPKAGHSSDSETPQFGLSIHLSELKESVTFHGEFSYSRRVSFLKRMTKTSSTRAIAVRGPAHAQRLEHFSVRRNASGVSISAVSSEEEHLELRPSPAMVVSPQPSISAEPHLETVPPSAIPTSNRFAVLTDEAPDLVAIAETVVDPLASPPQAVSPSVVPPLQTAVLAAEPLPPVAPTPPAALSASGQQGGAEFTSPPSTSRSASTGPTVTSVDQIPSGAALPAPRGESVADASNSSATASPSEPSLQLHLSRSEQPVEPVVSLTNPSPVGGTVEPSADTSVSQAPVCTTPSVPPFVPESDDAASSTAAFSPPPVPSRQVLVPLLAWVLLLLQLQAPPTLLLWLSLRTLLLCRCHGRVIPCFQSCQIFSPHRALILRAV